MIAPTEEPDSRTVAPSEQMTTNEGSSAISNASRHYETEHGGTTLGTVASFQALETMSTTSMDGANNDYGPVRTKSRERSVSIALGTEVQEYETENNLRATSTLTPRKKRAGDTLPDLGVHVNEMKQMMSEPDLQMYFEHCIRHVKEGLETNKYKDETSAFAAIVQEMDQRFADDPDLANKKRCLAAATAYSGLGKKELRVKDV